MSDPVMYPAVRVDDLPVPYVASERGSCAQCGASVWVDPKSLELAASMGRPVILCYCPDRGDGCADELLRLLATEVDDGP